ncbi:MAG: hypothetical protein K2Q33_06150, partial [Gammaproteobacteria bacterium]|nr:hypothetical protein [Gammaproteobacteria bacterium]
IKRSILVTSHYANLLVQEQAIKTGTKILPKQLASEIPIKIVETSKSSPIESSAASKKVDILILDDDKSFVRNLALFVFGDKTVAQYHDPKIFLREIQQYPKDTRIFLDNNFANSLLKGLHIAQELHQQGFKYLYLLSGEVFKEEDIPDYLTLIRKDQIENIKDL